MTTRHEFLKALHELVKPRGYVEIGVQTGASLCLASCPALGIDPQPVVRYALPPSTVVATYESDSFFALPRSQQLAIGLPQPLDLAFIDGLHLHEQALRDLANIQSWAHPGTIVVFDDVLPRGQGEAGRTPLPGDWTGDVWKVHPILDASRPDLRLTLVDVQPTGLLLVEITDPSADGYMSGVSLGEVVPDRVLTRALAVPPDVALKGLAR